MQVRSAVLTLVPISLEYLESADISEYSLRFSQLQYSIIYSAQPAISYRSHNAKTARFGGLRIRRAVMIDHNDYNICGPLRCMQLLSVTFASSKYNISTVYVSHSCVCY